MVLNIAIYYKQFNQSFVYTQLNGSKHSYVLLTIRLNINHLFTNSQMIKSLFQTIQFCIIHLLAQTLKAK